MGAEYSYHGKHVVGRHLLYETYGDRRKHRSSERCWKCGGSGKLLIEQECHLCRCEDRTTWSNYSKDCSCNGYGRQTSYEQCDDCHGRGY